MDWKRLSPRRGFPLGLAFLLFLCATTLLLPGDALGQGLIGTWTTRLPDGEVVELQINPDGTFVFDGEPGKYVVRGDVLITEMPGEAPEQYRFTLEGDRLLLKEMGQGRDLVFSRVKGAPSGSGEATGPPPGGLAGRLPSPAPGQAQEAERKPQEATPPPAGRKEAHPPTIGRSPQGEGRGAGGVFTSSDRSLSFRLPPGWTAQEVDTPQFRGVLVNPGLKQGAVEEARILLAVSRLTRQEQQLDLAQLVQTGLEKLGKDLPFLRLDSEPSLQRTPGGVGGRAVVNLSGVQPDGRALRGWVASLVSPPYSFSLLALVLGERWGHYRPPLEALFASLQVQAPERNRELEHALVGQWKGLYAKTDQHGGTSREALLILAPDQTFRYRYTSMISVQSGGSASSVSEEHDAGQWEVRGRTLLLLGQKDELIYDLELGSQGGVLTHFKAAGMVFSRSGS